MNDRKHNPRRSDLLNGERSISLSSPRRFPQPHRSGPIRRFAPVLGAALLFAAASFHGSVASAQTGSFGAGQVTIGTGLMSPTAVAVDSKGNVYIADNNLGSVYKETLSGGKFTQTTLRTGLADPYGVAVDTAFNVYIADTDNNRVLKETPGANGTYTETIVPTSGLEFDYGIAVDPRGDLFICDAINNRVVVETLSQGTYTQSILAQDLFSPQGVGLDAQGDVFIADTFNNRVLEENVEGALYGQEVVVDTGLNTPTGVAVDINGEVYIADSFNDRVVKATYAGPNKVYTVTVVPTSPLDQPTGVALDAEGNLYIADTNNSRVIEVLPTGSPNFGSVPVGTTSDPTTLTFTFTTGGMLDSPFALQPVSTRGVVFNDTGAGTCAKGIAYTAGQSCTVQITFTPPTPGGFSGLEQIVSSAGKVIATAVLTGTGEGPEVIFPGNSAEGVIGKSLGLSGPEGVAVDDGLEFFIADTMNNRVLQYAQGAKTTPTVGTGLKEPKALALDMLGNLYIQDYGSDRILMETPSATGYTQSVVYSPPGTTPPGVGPIALDPSGNLYVTIPGNATYVAQLLKFTHSSSGWTHIGINVPTTLLGATGIAADFSGNVYVAYLSGAVDKYTPTGSQVTDDGVTFLDYTQSTVGTVSSPHSLGVDAAGNVYVTDAENNLLLFTPAASGYNSTNLKTSSALSSPWGIAFGPDGIFIADAGNDRIVEESYLNAPNLSFPSTYPEMTSTAQTVAILNTGNANLSLPVPSTGTNPSVATGFELNSEATGACPLVNVNSGQPGIVDAGSSCNLTASFAPQAPGTYSGSLVLTDNAFPTTQSIGLSGNSAFPTPTITWPTPAAIAYGTPLSATQLNATASYNGTAVAGTFTYTPALGTVLGAGSQTLSVAFTPTNTNAYSSATATVTLVVNPAQLIIVADSFMRVYGTPNPTFTASYIGFIDGDTVASATTGAISLTTMATQQYPIGYWEIVIAQGTLAAPNYTLELVPGTLVVTQAPLTITANNVSVAQGAAIPALTFTATGFVNGDTAAVLRGAPIETTTATSSSPAGTYPITITQGMLSAEDYSLTFVNGTLTITAAQTRPPHADPPRRTRFSF
jgi:hypothetical protein